MCLCLNPDQRATVRAVVTSQQTSAVSHEAVTAILPGVAASPSPGPAPPGPLPGSPPRTPPVQPPTAAAGTLKITASALADPILVNGTTTYIITVQNDRQVADQELAVNVQVVGDGLSIASVPGSPVPALRSSATSVDFTPVREVFAGETLNPYRIEIRGQKAGQHKLRITATSRLTPGGVVAEATTTVTTP
jgi:hypothetical protein